jgi:putative ABC transport system permease protein
MIRLFYDWIENTGRDLRFVLRSLAKTPGFTATAIIVLAVGIGANTAIFSVVNTILLKPLSYPEPETLVQLMNVSPEGKFDDANVPKFNVWQQQTGIFQLVAAYDRGVALVNLTGGDNPEQVPGIHVTADYFPLFGARVLAGRTFTAAEDSPNGGHVVVLSYGLWKRRFGGNPNVVGTNIQLEGQPYLVVGVIGQEFVTKAGGDLWLPYQFDLSSQDMAHYFVVAARLKSGITPQMANAQLRLAADQYRRTYPGALGPREGFGVIPLQESMIGDTRPSLMILLGAVGLVLLIACANVGNLLLIRASAENVNWPRGPHSERAAFKSSGNCLRRAWRCRLLAAFWA